MLRGVAGVLEKHHKVQILDEAIEAAVALSHRYIPARQLPDKAVSLLDTACARVAVSQHATPAEVEDILRRRQALEVERGIIGREAAIGIEVTDSAGRVDAGLAETETTLAAAQTRWERGEGAGGGNPRTARQTARRGRAARSGRSETAAGETAARMRLTEAPKAAPSQADRGRREIQATKANASDPKPTAEPVQPSAAGDRRRCRPGAAAGTDGGTRRSAGRDAADPAFGRPQCHGRRWCRTGPAFRRDGCCPARPRRRSSLPRPCRSAWSARTTRWR